MYGRRRKEEGSVTGGCRSQWAHRRRLLVQGALTYCASGIFGLRAFEIINHNSAATCPQRDWCTCTEYSWEIHGSVLLTMRSLQFRGASTFPGYWGGAGVPFGGEGTLNTAVPLPNECTQFKWSSIRGPKPTCIGLDGQSPRLVTSDAFIR